MVREMGALPRRSVVELDIDDVVRVLVCDLDYAYHVVCCEQCNVKTVRI